MVIYGASSFKMRFLTFALNALWDDLEDSCFENREYVKLFLKSSGFVFTLKKKTFLNFVDVSTGINCF